MTADQSWRGVAAEDNDEVEHATGVKLQARSRKLLGVLVRPQKRLVIIAALVVIVDQVAALAGPLLIAYAIDSAVPALIDGNGRPLTWAILGYLGAGLASALLRMAFTRLAGRISQNLLLDLRRRVFDHSQNLSVSFHEKYTSGKLISRMTSDLDSIADLTEQGLEGLVSNALQVVVVGCALLVLDFPLGLVVLLSFVPLFMATRWFRRRSIKIYRRTRRHIAAVIVQFTETLNGLRAVQTFRRESRNEKIFAEDNRAYARANGDVMVSFAIYTPLVRIIGNIALAVVTIWGATRVVNGQLEIGVLAAFVLYLRRMYDPMDELAMFYNTFQSATAALEKISGVLQEEPGVPEPTDPVALPEPHGAVVAHAVDFSYTEGVEVLPTFDLAIPAGQTVALVGATGAGKSTVAKLISRFYDPSHGSVTLDGVDLRDLSTADLRRGVVMVTQESFLFSGSVADNIALGRPEASREEIELAAEEIGAGAFIRRLPDGFDTDVRKRGGRLSAGQRQLVAFARAFLADPAVLILDEATASLDIPNERAVQAALRTVLHGRTALIIAHRLSTVSIADRVLVMEHGRVVEDGTPADLIEGTGRFAGLHTAWRDSLV